LLVLKFRDRLDPTRFRSGKGDLIYHCPAGKTLTTTGTLVNDGTTLLYLARKHDCDGCELKALCCPKAPFRRIPRDIHEHARDVARSYPHRMRVLIQPVNYRVLRFVEF
jgi:hypothetical protein